MSLVATWTICQDGKWYEEPTWQGKGWFICLDDDDSPELVAERGLIPKDGAKAFLEKIGFSVSEVRPGYMGTGMQRMFGKNFKTAISYWFEMSECPPVPQRWDSVHAKKPGYMGCYYEFSK